MGSASTHTVAPSGGRDASGGWDGAHCAHYAEVRALPVARVEGCGRVCRTTLMCVREARTVCLCLEVRGASQLIGLERSLGL